MCIGGIIHEKSCRLYLINVPIASQMPNRIRLGLELVTHTSVIGEVFGLWAMFANMQSRENVSA